MHGRYVAGIYSTYNEVIATTEKVPYPTGEALIDYLPILLWLIASVPLEGSFRDEPPHDEETKMQLSHFVLSPGHFLLKTSISACNQRHNLIPVGIAVPCRCLSWWPHVSVPSEQRTDARMALVSWLLAQIASSPSIQGLSSL